MKKRKTRKEKVAISQKKKEAVFTIPERLLERKKVVVVRSSYFGLDLKRTIITTLIALAVEVVIYLKFRSLF